jgi:dipeptidyl-peptidase-4
VRSASGKGLVSTAACYKQLGIQELADLQDAVAWLTSEPYADAKRVGITGHSYGGFMSAFALTHSDTFALGVAGSGVYDWGMYDTIYTERYMQTPQLNPEGYAATSVIKAAANLRGHLVITHGVMDDNVHFQNAVQLVFALQKAEKDFDFMLYPQQRHGIRHPALRWQARRIEWEAIQEHLLMR